jgi:hypothetical protein
LKQRHGSGRWQRAKARQVLAAQLASSCLGYVGSVFAEHDAVTRYGMLDGRNRRVRTSGVLAWSDLLQDNERIAPLARARHADRVFWHPQAFGAAELDAESVRHAGISPVPAAGC